MKRIAIVLALYLVGTLASWSTAHMSAADGSIPWQVTLFEQNSGYLDVLVDTREAVIGSSGPWLDDLKIEVQLGDARGTVKKEFPLRPKGPSVITQRAVLRWVIAHNVPGVASVKPIRLTYVWFKPGLAFIEEPDNPQLRRLGYQRQFLTADPVKQPLTFSADQVTVMQDIEVP